MSLLPALMTAKSELMSSESSSVPPVEARAVLTSSPHHSPAGPPQFFVTSLSPAKGMHWSLQCYCLPHQKVPEVCVAGPGLLASGTVPSTHLLAQGTSSTPLNQIAGTEHDFPRMPKASGPLVSLHTQVCV